ncbi:MAG TPA: AAA domain-containing protein [Pseudonocardiaceae bacterium]
MPWEREDLPAPRKNYVWRHTVYAGIFDVARVREVLQNALRAPEGERDVEGRIKGHSALLSFAINSEGRLFKDSITLSSCAWAVGRTLEPGPDSPLWLNGFEIDQAQFVEYLFEIGDGKVPIEHAGSSGGGLGLIAGTAARVALDVVTGGISAVPAVISAVAAPAVGPIASKVIEKIGDSLAHDATDAISGKVKEKLKKDAEPVDDDEIPPPALGVKVLTVDDLAAITRWVAEKLGVGDALQPDNIRVKSYQVPERAVDEVSTDDFLNSFYVDDLARVAESIPLWGQGPSGPLNEYLRADQSIDQAKRTDVRESPAAVLRSVTPLSAPLGRWPAEPDRPLTLSQQFAINRIQQELMDPAARGLYAVNGPPGTGKTTMLRDMIAAVVVERAMRLADLKTARDAFQRTSKEWVIGDEDKVYRRTIYPLRDNLTGFEIVVASSNNGAVENITLEVPSSKTVDRETFPGADYFSGPATLLTGTSCWGAVAARLGRRDYRREFVDRFWWGNGDRGKKPRPELAGLVGLQQLLRNIATSGDDELLSWPDAVKRFNTAVYEARRMAHERQKIADIVARHAEPDGVLAALREVAEARRTEVTQQRARRADAELRAAQARAELDRARTNLAQAQDVLAAALAKADRMATQVTSATMAMNTHMATKPGLFHRLLHRHALSEWREASTPFTDALNEAARLQREAEAQHTTCENAAATRRAEVETADNTERHRAGLLAGCQADLDQAVAVLDSADNAVAERLAVLRREAEQIEDARTRWGRAVPGPEWRAEPGDRAAMEQRENSAPWMDEEFAAARSRVFLTALDLHRAVLTNEPSLVWRNLRAVMDVVNGDAPSDLEDETVLAAWRMLFFVVPVVSTTFASLSRMFGKFRRESLGWLFIDEAGQAVPQAAVGGLWRARRAVVVGDPRQLEPVLTLPWSGQTRLCRHFEVDPQWAPRNRSVQSTSDRLSTFGTWLPQPDGDEQEWVGSPLRVHRRCDLLMFNVSNKIAYDGMMVYGVPQRPDFDLLANSTWLDVGAPANGEKWNPVEGKYVQFTLDTIRTRIGKTMEAELLDGTTELPAWATDSVAREAELTRRVTESVFVVSPFRDVVEGLRIAVGNRLQSSLNRLGTVHTTQGKEADIVILVLGTAADQSGSRNWAAKTPNLLNVAVTRARRRLIVVGDYGNWSRHRNFEVLAGYGKRGLLKVVDVDTDWPRSS